MFRYKPSIHLSYPRQGYIYFVSLTYKDMPPEKKRKIEQLCQWVGGYNAQALLECVTTQEGVKNICARHYIASHTTLYRALKRYYENFPLDL